MTRMAGKACVCCVVALSVLGLLSGCAGQGSQAILDLVPLQAQLAAEYGASNVTVELEGRTLGVMLADPSAGDPARNWSEEQAREVAEVICRKYGSMHLMDRVRVALEAQQRGFMAGLNLSVAFHFERGELECGGGWRTRGAN